MLLCLNGCIVSLVAEVVQPVISQIDIMEESVNFSRLGEEDYRNTLPFGDRLLNAFDTILPFSNTPDGLELPHNLNTITVHFAFPDWHSPHKVQYAYLLEGRDQMWSKPSEEPFVMLRDLSAGTYAFRVKARDGSAGWSRPTSFHIVIRKAWWATGWAKAGLILIVLVLVALLLRYREQRRSEMREMRRLLETYRNSSLLSIASKEGPDDEDGFLRLINHTLEEHLSDENFGIAELCELLNISRTQLPRKLKKRTGLSTSHYIRFLRLQMAKELLGDQTLNVSEVAFAVGFSNAAYFSRVFKAQYGMSPSEARQELHK
ncbi:MAG: helix-turn-helix domain-containing protein [Saprospiraceae bacterium]|nr:helix-turn-helix domain-containing protein [Saprospiraceae bacterium]